MTSKIQKSLAVILLAAPMLAASAADITYNVDEIIGAGTVVGTITTDGTIGTLKNKDVVAFDLTVTAPNLEDGPSVVISNLNGGLAQYNSGGLSATATTI